MGKTGFRKPRAGNDVGKYFKSLCYRLPKRKDSHNRGPSASTSLSESAATNKITRLQSLGLGFGVHGVKVAEPETYILITASLPEDKPHPGGLQAGLEFLASQKET